MSTNTWRELRWRTACLILAILVLALSARLYHNYSTGRFARSQFWAHIVASFEDQGIYNEADLESSLYGKHSQDASLDIGRALIARRSILFVDVQDALSAALETTNAPVDFVGIAAEEWCQSEVIQNHLEEAAESYKGEWMTYRQQRLLRAAVDQPSGWTTAGFDWVLTITCPDPQSAQLKGEAILFAGVAVTLTLEDRGLVKVRVTLEKEDAPGGWSKTLGDRIITALKGIVDLEKRGVQVEIGYK